MTDYQKKYRTSSKLATDKIKEQEKEIDKLVYVVGEQRKHIEKMQEELDAAATGQQYQGDGDMKAHIEELQKLLGEECKLTAEQKTKIETLEKLSSRRHKDINELSCDYYNLKTEYKRLITKHEQLETVYHVQKEELKYLSRENSDYRLQSESMRGQIRSLEKAIEIITRKEGTK